MSKWSDYSKGKLEGRFELEIEQANNSPPPELDPQDFDPKALADEFLKENYPRFIRLIPELESYKFLKWDEEKNRYRWCIENRALSWLLVTIRKGTIAAGIEDFFLLKVGEGYVPMKLSTIRKSAGKQAGREAPTHWDDILDILENVP